MLAEDTEGKKAVDVARDKANNPTLFILERALRDSSVAAKAHIISHIMLANFIAGILGV